MNVSRNKKATGGKEQGRKIGVVVREFRLIRGSRLYETRSRNKN